MHKIRDLEKLYSAFGELIYVVAMEDGIIQKEETDELDEILKDHPWADEIKLSFDYEIKNQNSIESLYNRVMNYCQEFGPDPIYIELTEILMKIASACAGTGENERGVIRKFTVELMDRFKNDLQKNKLI